MKLAFLKIKTDYNCKTERFGSSYGGWDVAVDYVNKNSIVYSFGIGEDASFDISLINRYKMVVFAFDPTPRSIKWVKEQELNPNFHLNEYGIANFDGEINFFPPENPEHVSHSIIHNSKKESKPITLPVRRLESIMGELGHSTIDIMKMDIEGAEYQVIDDMISSRIFPKQILIEFHHRFPSVGLYKTKRAVETLKRVGYNIFSISKNYEEICFIHASIIKEDYE